MPPRVSVIVPFYNQVEFAEEAIESVLGQDFQDTELILADDGSSDGTPEVLRRYVRAGDDRIVLIEGEHNRGIAANINRALGAVRGELAAWLGGDDVMLAGKLRRQVDALDAHPEAVACVHDAEVFVSSTGEVLGRFSELYSGRAGVRSGGIDLVFDPTYFMLPSATMFRTRAGPPHGYDTRLTFANDWLWHIELLRHGGVVGLQDVLVRYRRHAANITSDPDTVARVLEEGLIALAIVDARYPELHRRVRRRAAAFHFAAARAAFTQGSTALAARHVSIALAEGGPVGAPRVAVNLVRTRHRRGDTPR